MNWLPKVTKEHLAVLGRAVSSNEVAAYRRNSGLSRWSLGLDVSPADTDVFVVVWIAVCFGLAVLMSLMSHWSILTVVFSIIVVVSIIIFFRASDRSIRRHVRFDEFAKQFGLRYDPIGSHEAIGTGLIFDVGHSRIYRGVLSYQYEGKRLLEIGRYQYSKGSGKNKRTYYWWYAAVRMTRHLPHMVLDSKNNNSLISNLPVLLPNSQRMSLEGDFDNYFTLYAPKQYDVDARYVLTPDVMAALVDSSADFDAEIIDDVVFFYTPDKDAPDEKMLGELFAVLNVVGRELHDQTDRYADDRVANSRRTNEVAKQGRRLKKWKMPGV